MAEYLNQVIQKDYLAFAQLQNLLIVCRLELLETAYGTIVNEEQSLTTFLGLISGICKTHRLEAETDALGRVIKVICVENKPGEFEEK